MSDHKGEATVKDTHDRLEAVEAKASKSENVLQWMLAAAKGLGLANFIVLVGFVVLVIFAWQYQNRAWAQDMREISDAGISAAITPVAVKQEAIVEFVKDQKQFNREVLRLVGELAADNRAIYRRIETGDRQPRLEKPLPVPVIDGGP